MFTKQEIKDINLLIEFFHNSCNCNDTKLCENCAEEKAANRLITKITNQEKSGAKPKKNVPYWVMKNNM